MSESAAATPTTPAGTFARYASIALVPPTITAAVAGLLVLAYQHGSLFHQIMVWLTASLFSGGLQIAYVLYLRKQSEVTDYDVPLKEQRTKPYIVSAVLAAVGFGLLFYLNAAILLLAMMFIHVVNTLVLIAINRVWKISAHMMGLLGPLPLLIPLFGMNLLYVAPVAILLGWARVHLQTHTIPQVIAGAVLGFFLTFLQLFLILPYAML